MLRRFNHNTPPDKPLLTKRNKVAGGEVEPSRRRQRVGDHRYNSRQKVEYHAPLHVVRRGALFGPSTRLWRTCKRVARHKILQAANYYSQWDYMCGEEV